MEAKYQGTGRGRCWPLCDYIARVSDMGLRGNFDEVRGEFLWLCRNRSVREEASLEKFKGETQPAFANLDVY